MRELVTRRAGQHPLRIFQTPAGGFSEAPSVPARVLAARNVNHVAAGHSANTHVQGRMWASSRVNQGVPRGRSALFEGRVALWHTDDNFWQRGSRIITT